MRKYGKVYSDEIKFYNEMKQKELNTELVNYNTKKCRHIPKLE